MNENVVPNALKHGALSEILILPGEDVQEFEKLKNALFEEYKPSGASEERIIVAIAKAFWQERRLALYQYVRHARAGRTPGERRDPHGVDRSIAKFLGAPFVPPEIPPKSAEELLKEELLEHSDVLTLEQLQKELDVDAKLQAKIDRLFKRFFQVRAMKGIAGLTLSPAPALQKLEPVLELTAQEAS